ncbi:hypothetical protein [Methylopila sp. 73B]|uniref:hypothetical protein n=1 Tax=Methylopila sp. 73B TaxID=1120792 RepID=UPI000372DC73|nr:hypothetical protein [Methylopila sp. 73B]
MTKETYTVTKLAGPYVAGHRVSVGDTLELTENEARYELQTQAIVRKGEKLPSDKPTPELEQIQANARGETVTPAEPAASEPTPAPSAPTPTPAPAAGDGAAKTSSPASKPS